MPMMFAILVWLCGAVFRRRSAHMRVCVCVRVCVCAYGEFLVCGGGGSLEWCVAT